MENLFSGNVFIFYCFDVGEDINLKKVKLSNKLIYKNVSPSKYFKNYHAPLIIELPRPNNSSSFLSAKLHNFGVISLAYKIPFEDNLETLKRNIESIDAEFKEQSVLDARSIFKTIENCIKHPKFFHLKNSYVVIQVDPNNIYGDAVNLKEQYGNMIASIVRFETESLSENQKNELLDSAIGYYRGDLIVIDTEASFVYDDEYEELLDLFEFANMQQMELQYFDKVLDQHLNVVYEQEIRKLPLRAYVPFLGSLKSDPIDDLGKLKVDISVIIERLENSIRLVGQAYYSEVYSVLVEKLDIANWRESVNSKLKIIQEIRAVYEEKIASVREELLSVLVIVLIFIEVILGILHYFK